MRKFFLKINVITVLVILTGCSSADNLLIERRIKTVKNEDLKPLTGIADITDRVDSPEDRVFISFKTERRFKVSNITGPAGNITRRGILEAIKGNHSEAEFLFNETGFLLNDGSPQNNIAVVYEASGRYGEAFSMYYRALLISPDEKIFRNNFLLFLNQVYHEKKP